MFFLHTFDHVTKAVCFYVRTACRDFQRNKRHIQNRVFGVRFLETKAETNAYSFSIKEFPASDLFTLHEDITSLAAFMGTHCKSKLYCFRRCHLYHRELCVPGLFESAFRTCVTRKDHVCKNLISVHNELLSSSSQHTSGARLCLREVRT